MEGSFITKGAIIESQGKCFIVALWRNKAAAKDVPWQIPSANFLEGLKSKEPYQVLMSQPELAGKEVAVPDEITLVKLISEAD